MTALYIIRDRGTSTVVSTVVFSLASIECSDNEGNV